MGRFFAVHRFFCINCGKEGIPLARQTSLKKEKFHRKKLYCATCNKVLNHIECRSDIEVYEFKEQYQEGLFQQEAIESLFYMEGVQ